MLLDWSLITPEALQALDLEKLLAEVEPRECFNFSQELVRLGNLPDRWSPAEATCIEFSIHVTGMVLHPDQPSEPFGPMFRLGESRSPIPADFPRETLKALHLWAAGLKDAELRARFLDAIWVQAKHPQAAKEAVSAYMASAERLLDPQHWTAYAKRMERAVRLAAKLGKPGAELVDSALQEVLSVVRRLAGVDPLYLTLRMTQLLLEFRRGDGAELARYTSMVAYSAERDGDFWRAKDYFNLAADCCRTATQPDDMAVYRRAAAEALVKEAEVALSQTGRGAMVAATVLSSAVQAMRQVPGGKGRAEELGGRLVALQEQSMSELKRVSTSIDTSDLVHAAVERVKGKSFMEAVLRFCQMLQPPNLDALQKQVVGLAQVAVFGSIEPSEVVNARGRVVAKVPGLELGSTDVSLPGLRWRMFRCAGMRRNLNAQAVIEPARQVILQEHAPDRTQVLELIQYSPWIPDGHHESIARAIVAGFHGDMLLVGHLVPIQFEAVVRQVVEAGGAPAPMLKPDGTQEERPLSALLESAEAKQAFGEDGVFELQGLLTEQLGSNLRNEVAHGLTPDGDFFSGEFIYAWWLLLRCVTLSSHMARTNQAESANPSKSDEGTE